MSSLRFCVYVEICGRKFFGVLGMESVFQSAFPRWNALEKKRKLCHFLRLLLGHGEKPHNTQRDDYGYHSEHFAYAYDRHAANEHHYGYDQKQQGCRREVFRTDETARYERGNEYSFECAGCHAFICLIPR